MMTAELQAANIDSPCAPNFFLGIDCEETERWAEMLPLLEEAEGKALFFPDEHSYCRSFADPAPRYAGVWCAKEAVYKAVSSVFRLTLRDIKIVSDGSSQPRVEFSNKDLSGWEKSISLSITHTSRTAMAAAIFHVFREESK